MTTFWVSSPSLVPVITIVRGDLVRIWSRRRDSLSCCPCWSHGSDVVRHVPKKTCRFFKGYVSLHVGALRFSSLEFHQILSLDYEIWWWCFQSFPRFFPDCLGFFCNFVVPGNWDTMLPSEAQLLAAKSPMHLGISRRCYRKLRKEWWIMAWLFILEFMWQLMNIDAICAFYIKIHLRSFPLIEVGINSCLIHSWTIDRWCWEDEWP